MEYRRLGRTDIKVSAIGLGTMTWGQQNSEAEGHAQLDYALDHGINLVDTAELYAIPPRAETAGRTEEIIGTWLKKTGRRDKIVLATKIAGPSDHMTWFREDGKARRHDRENIQDAVEKSLGRLQTDYIDLYQLHWPDRRVVLFGADRGEVPETLPEETLRALEEVVKAGKVRHVGVSNETPWGVMEYLRLADRHGLPRMHSIQNVYNLVSRAFDLGLAEIAQREDVGLLAYSPLAQGYLTGKYIGGALPKGSRKQLFSRLQRYESEATLEAVEAYVALAREHGLDPAQMAIRFVHDRPFVTSVLIGATTMEQLRTDIAAADVTLGEDVIKGIRAIHRRYPNPAL
jgi:aryl-alcohol dehydrogenase-like predicted oxidoreductase